MTWTVHTGDCREVLASLPEASVDTIICDPPYGLAFMGKEWDQSVPGPDYWRAAMRVAKPGAMLLAFGGTRTWHHLALAIEAAGWEIRDSMMWLYGSGFPKSLNIAKATEAKAWTGWGTALKPAWEPIILAMKPLDGTFAENAQRHGVAGLAIDAARIGYGDLSLDEVRRQAGSPTKGGSNRPSEFSMKERPVSFNATGRWPANVLLDEDAAAQLDEQSGDLKAGWRPAHRQGVGFGGGATGTSIDGEHENIGGGAASRFFYVAKAARSERGVGNDHPTVKPVDLMRYLCRLTRTPTGGVVLDPFCGSGSTGVGAMLDGRDFIGVELDAHNADIARQRIAAADPIGRQEDIFA